MRSGLSPRLWRSHATVSRGYVSPASRRWSPSHSDAVRRTECTPLHILEDFERTTPVVVATRSDRFLDALTSPGEAVVVTSRQEDGSVSLVRPSASQLAPWLERYRGLGVVRAEGYLPNVLYAAQTSAGPYNNHVSTAAGRQRSFTSGGT